MTNNLSVDKSFLCRDINGNVHIVKQSELVQRASVYGVLIKDASVLLVKNFNSESLWDLPGGGIESGEELVSALRREVAEETGLHLVHEPELISQFVEYFYDTVSNRGWESTRSFFKVQWEGDPLLPGNNDDITECRFFTLPLDPSQVTGVAREIISLSML